MLDLLNLLLSLLILDKLSLVGQSSKHINLEQTFFGKHINLGQTVFGKHHNRGQIVFDVRHSVKQRVKSFKMLLL